MKFSIMQPVLKHALSIIGKMASTKSTLPILRCIVFRSQDESIMLTASNVEQSVHCWAGALINEPGAIAIPATILTELVNSLPGDRIDFDVDDKCNVKVACKGHKSTIKGMDPEDFPAVPVFSENGYSSVSLAPAALVALIGGVVDAAADDVTRPTLSGVEVAINSEKVGMVTTDGFRLGKTSRTDISSMYDEPITRIVPGKAMDALVKMAAGATHADVAMLDNQMLVKLQFSDTKPVQRIDFATSLVAGNFPDYSRIIPNTFTVEAVALVEPLIAAVKTAMLFGRDDADAITLDIGDNLITVSATSAELGNVSSVVEARTLESVTARVNGLFLLDTLKTCPAESVKITGTNSMRPLSLYPVGSGQIDDWFHLIMPMQKN